MRRTAPHIRTAAGVASYRTNDDGSITAVLDGGEEVRGEACLNTICYASRHPPLPATPRCRATCSSVPMASGPTCAPRRPPRQPRDQDTCYLVSSFSPYLTHRL